MITLRHLVVVTVTVALVMAAGIAAVGIVSAGSRGKPVLTAHIPDGSITPGEETTLNLFVLNGGDVDYADGEAGVSRVTTARNVRLTLESGRAPLDVETGTTPVGSIPEGVSSAVGFEISVRDDAKPGVYKLPLEVKYRFTRQISGATSPVYQDREKTETLRVPVEVERDARFEVVNTSATSFADGTGTVGLEVRNVGRELARDARVTFTSKTTGLTFGGARSAETFVGDWAADEARTLEFEGDLVQRADRRPFLFTAQVEYADPDGETRTSETLIAGATPGSRASQFAIVGTDSDFAVGDTGTLSITVQNTGETEINDARIALTSEDPKLTFAGPGSAATYIGQLQAGERTTVAVEASLADGADVRQYPLAATMTFTDAAGDTRTSDPIPTAVTPRARASQFAVINVSANLAAGESGPVRLQVRNTESTVRDARLVVSSGDSKLTFAGSATASTFVGTWAADEVRTFVYTADMADNADVRPYPISASATYKTIDGETRQSDASVAGVVPRVKRFEVRDIRSTLAVGEEGTLRADVVNTGETRVGNAVVVFESTNPTVNPVETEYRIGTLAPGERSSFSFDIEISDTANGGPRQFSVRVRYRDSNDNIRRSDPLDIDAMVDDKRDVFNVAPVEASLTAGASGPLRLEVTNSANQTLTDISAKLFTNDPLSSTDDEAFIEELAPGESATITFGLQTGSGAMAKVYPINLDFQYDDADGDTLLSDTYKVPVSVREREGRGPSPVVILAAVLLVILAAGGGYYWFRVR